MPTLNNQAILELYVQETAQWVPKNIWYVKYRTYLEMVSCIPKYIMYTKVCIEEQFISKYMHCIDFKHC